MQPNIPIPTDNLYKFMALFGLTVIIASLVGLTFVSQVSNDRITALVPKIFALPEAEASADQRVLMKRILEIEVSDRNTDMKLLAVSTVAGFFVAFWGFWEWRRIQPLHDELLELQVAKARREVNGNLDYRELSPKPGPKKKRGKKLKS